MCWSSPTWPLRQLPRSGPGGRAAGLVLALLALAAPVARTGAQPAGLPSLPVSKPWVLVVAAQTDEDSYENTLAGFHLGVTESTWLSFEAGASRAPASRADVSAGLIAAGIEHDFGPAGIGVSVEDWGDSGNLESRDLEAEVFFGDERYRVALSYESRAIDIYFAAPLRPDVLRRARIDADGIGIRGRLLLGSDWQIYGAWMHYDYPRGLRLVPRADRLNLLSVSAVTLAYSFIDEYASFGVERAFGQKLLNIDIGRDRSTIDDEVLRSLSAAVLWPVADRLDLEFTLGSSRSGALGSSLYGGLGFYVYGG